MRQLTFSILLLVLICTGLNAQDSKETPPAIIPWPVEVKKAGPCFVVDTATVIYYNDSRLQPAGLLLQSYLKQQPVSGTAPALVNTRPVGNLIVLQLDTIAIPQVSGYDLRIEKSQVSITAHDAAGIVHGIQTLRQLWQTTVGKALIIPGYTIYDYPRFGYRSMALDVSRHLFPVSFIKQYIDLLSLYKFNTFHWHLTDDQGWRIEIKQYPRLQSISAWRKQTLIGHKKETPHHFDGQRYGGYYSQQEIKEVVQYATQRGITIIPEIEMPGHALAALAAYPALGCTGGPYETAPFWGVFDDVFCAGNDSTFTFLQQVLGEVLALFPSRYIHIGGDECPKARWKTCAKCQSRMKTLALKDEHDLQSYFIQRIEKYLNSKGRDIIGWDEILEGGLAPNATVMSWQGEEGGIAAARQKHQVIMTPESHVYFNYYQSRNTTEPVAAGHYIPLSKVYSYQPAASLPDSFQTYIAGVEGQAWSEYMNNEQLAAYMIFPRALALAELAWTPVRLRNYDHFLQRLRQQTPLLEQQGIHNAPNFDEVTGAGIQARRGSVELSLYSSYPGAIIRYTTDNSLPNPQSAAYTAPITMKKTGILRAQAFDEKGQPIGRVYEQPVRVHKAIGAPVVLNHQPLARWNPGVNTLVNGIAGTHRYNDAQWMGFDGDKLQAVVDLGVAQSIRNIAINFLNYHWQRVWAPVVLEILVSEDGVHYRKVFTQKDFPVNGINTVQAVIKPVKARYVKISSNNKGLLPATEYGAGSKALLMIDEIMID
jgi:hexosaminidase